MVLHHNEWLWGTSIYVIEDNGSAIIKMAFQNSDPGVCYLSDLSVIPDKRRLGLAKQLLKFCESFCRDNNIFRIDLDVEVRNGIAENLYRKLGYTYSIDEEDGYRKMHKMLVHTD